MPSVDPPLAADYREPRGHLLSFVVTGDAHQVLARRRALATAATRSGSKPNFVCSCLERRRGAERLHADDVTRAVPRTAPSRSSTPAPPRRAPSPRAAGRSPGTREVGRRRAPRTASTRRASATPSPRSCSCASTAKTQLAARRDQDHLRLPGRRVGEHVRSARDAGRRAVPRPIEGRQRLA